MSSSLKELKAKQFLYWAWITVLIQFLIVLGQVASGQSLGLSLIGESQVVKGFTGVSFVNTLEGIFLRGYGTFPHPNVLGGYMLMILLLLELVSETISTKLSKNLLTTLQGILGLVILLTFSRSAFIIYLLFVVYKLYSLYSNGKAVNKVFAFNPLIIILERIIRTNETDREQLWNSGIELLGNHPYLGTGVLQSIRYYGNLDSIPSTAAGITLLQPIHNVFLLILVEFGSIIGGIGILIFLLFVIFTIVRTPSEKKLFVVLIFISMIFIMSIDHYLYTLPQGLLISFILLKVAHEGSETFDY